MINCINYTIKKCDRLKLFHGVRVCLLDSEGRAFVMFNKKLESVTFPGGSIEKGESTEEAAQREMQEELGIEVKELEEFAHIQITSYKIKEYYFSGNVMIYITRKWVGKLLHKEPAKHLEPRWISADHGDIDFVIRPLITKICLSNDFKFTSYHASIGYREIE